MTIAYYSHLIYFWLVVFERIYVENNQRSNHTTQVWKQAFMTVFFLSGLMEFTLNTTMYSFDPGFQIAESYLWLHGVVQYASRFLLGCCFLLICIFSFRVFIFWPALIDRHRNMYVFSLVFFLMTFFSRRV